MIKVGLFGIGLDTYWLQFEGLLERLGLTGDTQKDLTINGQNINESKAIKEIEKKAQSFVLSVATGSYSFVSRFSSDKK